jgi:hypothetical protein
MDLKNYKAFLVEYERGNATVMLIDKAVQALLADLPHGLREQQPAPEPSVERVETPALTRLLEDGVKVGTFQDGWFTPQNVSLHSAYQSDLACATASLRDRLKRAEQERDAAHCKADEECRLRVAAETARDAAREEVKRLRAELAERPASTQPAAPSSRLWISGIPYEVTLTTRAAPDGEKKDGQQKREGK